MKKTYSENIDIFIPYFKKISKKEVVVPICDVYYFDVVSILGKIELEIQKIKKRYTDSEKIQLTVNLLGGMHSIKEDDEFKFYEGLNDLIKLYENTNKNLKIKVNVSYPLEIIKEFTKEKILVFLNSVYSKNINEITFEIYSTIDSVNKANKVEYDLKTIQEILNKINLLRFKKIKINLLTYFGLFGSDVYEDEENLLNISKLKFNKFFLSPVVVLKNLPICKRFLKEEYTPLVFEEFLPFTKKVVEEFLVNSEKNLEQIHLIYMAEEYIKENYVEGIYQKDLEELVFSELWYNKLLEEIRSLNVKVKKLEVFLEKKYINALIGQDNKNLIRFKKLYDIELELKSIEELTMLEYIKNVMYKKFNNFKKFNNLKKVLNKNIKIEKIGLGNEVVYIKILELYTR